MAHTKRGACLGLTLIAMVACTAGRLPEPGASGGAPVELEFGLSSYATPGQIRKQLQADASWTTSDRRARTRTGCPRFAETKITVPRFAAHGFAGSLRLDFINGHLFRILFYLDEAARYIDWLRTHGVMLNSVGVAFPSPGAVYDALTVAKRAALRRVVGHEAGGRSQSLATGVRNALTGFT